mgnify:CR=1 FL=1
MHRCHRVGILTQLDPVHDCWRVSVANCISPSIYFGSDLCVNVRDEITQVSFSSLANLSKERAFTSSNAGSLQLSVHLKLAFN